MARKEWHEPSTRCAWGRVVNAPITVDEDTIVIFENGTNNVGRVFHHQNHGKVRMATWRKGQYGPFVYVQWEDGYTSYFDDYGNGIIYDASCGYINKTGYEQPEDLSKENKRSKPAQQNEEEQDAGGLFGRRKERSSNKGPLWWRIIKWIIKLPFKLLGF